MTRPLGINARDKYCESRCGRRHRRKYEHRRVASLPTSSIVNCNKLTLIQLLVNYTSASSSMNFGMIIIKYILVTPKFIQSCFKYAGRFSMHNVIR